MLNFQKLPLVLRAVRQSSATGKLVVNNAEEQAVLAFKNGRLLDARLKADQEQTAGEVALYRLLNWQAGQMEWQSGQLGPDQTIDDQQESDFYQAAEDLTGLGFFDKAAIPAETLQAFLAAPSLSVNRSRLPVPLPPGSPFNLGVAVTSLGELVEKLRQNRFTGYLCWQDQPENALMIFEYGQPKMAFLQQEGQEYRGALAWQRLMSLVVLPPCTLATVEIKILASYRALLGDYKPYQALPATFNNFKRLETAFERGKHSGVIRLKLELVEVFHLIYEGRAVGTFGLEADSTKLKLLGGGLTLLLENSQAQIDVFVVRAENLEKPAQPFTATEITTLASTLNAVVGLASELMIGGQATQKLGETVTQLSSQYPFLKSLPQQDLPPDSDRRKETFSRWLGQLSNVERDVAFRGFEQLFENYLQPTCLKVGPTMFHEMIVRALGPTDATALQQMGLKVDFFDPPPLSPVAPSGSEASLKDEQNPYDF